jgi:hypothetical protein
MLASIPASILNQSRIDSGIPNRLRLNSSRSSERREVPDGQFFYGQLDFCATIASTAASISACVTTALFALSTDTVSQEACRMVP